MLEQHENISADSGHLQEAAAYRVDNTENPWSGSIMAIVWGFILGGFILNFLYLDYILPTVGTALIYIGFRSLRATNARFRKAWQLSIVTMIYQVLSLAFTATPLNALAYPNEGYTAAGIAMAAVATALRIAMLLYFSSALNEVSARIIGAGKIGKPARWAAILFSVTFVVAILGLGNNGFVLIVFLVCLILIAVALLRIPASLRVFGMIPARSLARIGPGTLIVSYLAAAIAIVVLGGLFFGRIGVTPTPYKAPVNSELRQKLVSMSFPEEALSYLSDNAVAGMGDAKLIKPWMQSSGDSWLNDDDELDSCIIQIVSDDHTMYVMQYFVFSGNSTIRQDGIQIIPGFGAANIEIIESGLFYSKDGQVYTSPFPRLVDEYREDSFIVGFRCIAASFGFPAASLNRGGYVFYSYDIQGDYDFEEHIFPDMLSYIHTNTFINFPFVYPDMLIGDDDIFGNPGRVILQHQAGGYNLPDDDEDDATDDQS